MMTDTASQASDFALCLPGACGRMGRMIRSVLTEEGISLSAATEHENSPEVGQKAEGCTITSDAADLGQGPGHVIVDFTGPEATRRHIEIAVSTNTPMVIGTTGLTQDDEKLITAASQQIPIVYCANTSVGVTLLAQLVRQVARSLADDWDIEIIETHHNQKVDAPSGTALALGQAAAEGRDVALSDVKDTVRDGYTGARKKGDIGFAVLRGGDIAGEHSVIFHGQQDRIELTHKAGGRVIFARGAVRAAGFASSAQPGLYSMDDVLSQG